ncbi:hypothetical protein ACFQ5X_47675 [Streptomyces kaempferi]|uniref:Uncharacterized protein n=1 Tax=Streptomyces kaempferi TaxID=333725 RepID=A0ABW3XWY7_9ACTN
MAQRYPVAELIPIYTDCRCEPTPLLVTKDPSHAVDKQLREDAHNAIARDIGRSNAGRRSPTIAAL